MSVGKMIGLAGLLFLCAITGLLVVFLPPGFLVRVLALPAGFGFLTLCWMLRRKGAGLPGRFVFFIFMATVCFSVIWPRYVFFSIGGPHVNPQTLSVLTALLVFLFWVVYSPEFSARIRELIFGASSIGVLVVLWFCWRLLASALGDFAIVSVIDYVRDFVYVSSFFLIGCAIASYENGPKWLLRVVVGSGFLVAAAGLIEAFTQRNYFVQFASGGDSQAVADALKTILLDKTRDGSYRVQSTFDHPIVFAQFISAVIPLAAYFAFYERRWLWRLLGFLFVPIGVLAIVKSGSRAGLVSLAVALAFVAVVVWLRSMVSKGFGKAFAIAALPVFLFGLIAAYFVVQELVLGRSYGEAGSTSVRLKMVLDGVSALYESPIWGFGHGMALFKAGVVSGHTGTATIDSFLLTIALDYGYVGLIVFLVIIGIFSIKGGLAAVRLRGEDGAQVGLIVAAVLALVATFAGLSIGNNMTLLWLLIAAAIPSISKASANLPRVR